MHDNTNQLDNIAIKIEEENFKDAIEIINENIYRKDKKNRLQKANEFLSQAYKNKKFNSERALEVYTIAIERVLLDNLHGALGAQTVKFFRSIGAVGRVAQDIVDQFKKNTGATDQRVARKGFLAKIVGR